MAIAEIFLNKKPAFWPAGLSVGAPITMDASIREGHGQRFRVTENSLENAQFASDHIEPLPKLLSMDVVVTAHPDQLIPNTVSTRHIRTYRQLEDLANLRIPFDVVTSLEIITNVVFQSLGTQRTATDGKSLVINCQLKKIGIATVDIAQNLADAATEIALGAEDIGALAPRTETA